MLCGGVAFTLCDPDSSRGVWRTVQFKWPTNGPLGSDPHWMPGWSPVVWLLICGVAAVVGIWLLANVFLRLLTEVPRCRRCSYDLAGVSRVECPECGWEIGRRAGHRSWIWRDANLRTGSLCLVVACAAWVAATVERRGVLVLLPDRVLAELVLRTPDPGFWNWKAAAHEEFAHRTKSGMVSHGLLRAMVRRSGVVRYTEISLMALTEDGDLMEPRDRPRRLGMKWVMRPVCSGLIVTLDDTDGVLVDTSSMRLSAQGGPADLQIEQFVTTARDNSASYLWLGRGPGCGTGAPGPFIFRQGPPERMRVRATVGRSGSNLDLGTFWIDISPAGDGP